MGAVFGGVSAWPRAATTSPHAEGREDDGRATTADTLYTDQVWTNKHCNVSTHIERLYEAWNRWSDRSHPDEDVWQPGLRALQHIVREAEAAGRRVRGLGGGWSLSEAAVTPDFLVDTKQLNNLVIGMSTAFLEPHYQGNPQHLVFAQCGVSVMELNPHWRLLHCVAHVRRQQWTTIGGAISTGTHGAAHAFGAMQESIVGASWRGGGHLWGGRASSRCGSQQL